MPLIETREELGKWGSGAGDPIQTRLDSLLGLRHIRQLGGWTERSGGQCWLPHVSRSPSRHVVASLLPCGVYGHVLSLASELQVEGMCVTFKRKL